MRLTIVPVLINETAPRLLKIRRITALWGFSEAAFGGVLHALNLPFRGLFISGAAVIFISLIAYNSTNKNQIIKAAVTVILIKALVSPHSPATAYLAVFMQGLMGYILFYYKRFFKISALLLGLSAGFFSAFQKLLVLTILYGNTLWESIDIFINFMVSQFTMTKISEYRYSYLLIAVYAAVHTTGGIVSGLLAGRIPDKINKMNVSIKQDLKLEDNQLLNPQKKAKRKWWRRASSILIMLLSSFLVILSYITPYIGRDTAADVIIMVARSFLVMFIWYSFLSPLVLKLLNKILKKRQHQYSAELSEMIGLFPQFRSIISYIWLKTSSLKGVKRIIDFLKYSFIILLNYEEDLPPDR